MIRNFYTVIFIVWKTLFGLLSNINRQQRVKVEDYRKLKQLFRSLIYMLSDQKVSRTG